MRVDLEQILESFGQGASVPFHLSFSSRPSPRAEQPCSQHGSWVPRRGQRERKWKLFISFFTFIYLFNPIVICIKKKTFCLICGSSTCKIKCVLLFIVNPGKYNFNFSGLLPPSSHTSWGVGYIVYNGLYLISVQNCIAHCVSWVSI